MNRPAPGDGPGLAVVAPFFIIAPLGLIVAGVLLLGASADIFLAINTPRLVAVTHAVVLGWLTLSIMGATYQLGPAVFGGRLVSVRLAPIQLLIHVTSIGIFLMALDSWNVGMMGIGAVAMVVSLLLFLVNAIPAVRWFRSSSLPQLYVSVAILFFVATASLGLTFVGTLEHLWFPITQGRLAGHAHLGLVGWLALMLMGVSYRLVPMFHITPASVPRFARVALWLTTAATIAAFLVLSTNPGPEWRVTLALALISGPILWLVDMVQILRRRARRRLDIHGHATIVSLGFLCLAMVAGILAAIGEPVAPSAEPARLQLAYGALGVGGWAGATLLANSFKIVPFLVWNARYRQIAGLAPVPGVSELASSRGAHATLVTLSMAVVLIAGGALSGQLLVVRSGGFLLAAAGFCQSGTLLAIVARRYPVAARSPQQTGGLSS